MTERNCDMCGQCIIYSGHASDYAYKINVKGKFHYFCSDSCYELGKNMKTRVIIDTKPLNRARAVYGDVNQIAVCVEELSELTKVLAKYFRYDKSTALEKLHDDALDEVTDVYIILEHVKGIFNLRNDEINKRAEAKLGRLQRWLDTSDDFSYTMEDREV